MPQPEPRTHWDPRRRVWTSAGPGPPPQASGGGAVAADPKTIPPGRRRRREPDPGRRSGCSARDHRIADPRARPRGRRARVGNPIRLQPDGVARDAGTTCSRPGHRTSALVMTSRHRRLLHSEHVRNNRRLRNFHSFVVRRLPEARRCTHPSFGGGGHTCPEASLRGDRAWRRRRSDRRGHRSQFASRQPRGRGRSRSRQEQPGRPRGGRRPARRRHRRSTNCSPRPSSGRIRTPRRAGES